jgi:aspartate-semialdehyde dehydrogenase
MVDNVIPFIKGEEEKSEQEPLKIWGTLAGGKIATATSPQITAQCIRVPVSDGHMAAVFVKFEKNPGREQILSAWKEFSGKPQQLKLPSAPTPFLNYFDDDTRPQTKLDRDNGNGQAISIGRLRPDTAMFDWRFVALSHNTVRGAAGGAVLTAELLASQGYLTAK